MHIMKLHQNHRVSKIHAAPPRPTPLGAAIFAAIVSAPIGVVLLLVDVLWL